MSHENIERLAKYLSPAMLGKAGGLMAAIALLLFLFLPTGTSDGRNAVHGTVSVSGEPVSKGWVSFLPAGDAGPRVFAEITEGNFRFTAGNGPAEGQYRILLDLGTGNQVPVEMVEVRNGMNSFEFDVPFSE